MEGRRCPGLYVLSSFMKSFSLPLGRAALALILSAPAYLAAMPGWAQDSEGKQSGLEQVSASILHRTISLPEIGFKEGARLTGLGATRDLFFPVPRSMKFNAQLTLAYESATSIDARRSVEVMIGERTLLLKPFNGTTERDSIKIPVNVADVSNGFIKVTVRYGHAMQEDRCVDMRYAGDHLTILPETNLKISFDRNGVDSVASALSLMPRDVSIYLPARELSAPEFGAALDTARALREMGRQVKFENLPGPDLTFQIPQANASSTASPATPSQTPAISANQPAAQTPVGPAGLVQPSAMTFAPRLESPFAKSPTNAAPLAAPIAPNQPAATVPANGFDSPSAWTRGAIVIASGQDLANFVAQSRTPLYREDAKPDGQSSSLSLINFSNGPAILISGQDPQSAARLIGSNWLSAGVRPIISTDGDILQIRSNGPLTFDRLQTDLGARDVLDRAQWSVSISAKDLPLHRRLSALHLNVAVAPDEGQTNAVVTAFFNETMMQSVSTGADMRAPLAFNIPNGLAGMNNSLRVMVQRQRQSGECAMQSVGYPSQLLGSSEILTEPASEVLHDFFDVASAYREGVTIFLDSRGPVTQRSQLSFLTELASNLIPPAAPLAIRFADPGLNAQTNGPFIALTTRAPENSEPSVRFDQGRTLIKGPDGRTLANLSAMKSTAIVQLLRAGLNQGLWIRPAAEESEIVAPSKLLLDRGNVAIIDRSGVAFSYSTERDRLVQVLYPERMSLAEIANAYRPWVIGGLWLALTLLVAMSMQRFYSKSRNTRAS
ncbi:MAG: hypothetical protein EBY21_03390 [Alphaproteobacteria bacterium]|nr:hypothetical protein [Alphaproteobacteria bacterium]